LGDLVPQLPYLLFRKDYGTVHIDDAERRLATNAKGRGLDGGFQDAQRQRPVRRLAVMQRLKLAPRLVPKPLWGISAYRLLPARVWKRIRAEALEAAGGSCSVCGERREKGMVADEVWAYAGTVATLVEVRILCPDCNAVTHIGQAAISGYLDVARDHMAKVNGISRREAAQRFMVAAQVSKDMSGLSWSVAVAPDLLARYPELELVANAYPPARSMVPTASLSDQ
jgi:hypothetical protein